MGVKINNTVRIPKEDSSTVSMLDFVVGSKNDTGKTVNFPIGAFPSDGGELAILTNYPTTDASKVGQKFIYKGNEWKYHSQAELDDLGWTTVSEGFPAPVSKATNPFIYNANQISYTINILSDGYQLGNISDTQQPREIDFLGLGKPNLIKIWQIKQGDEVGLFRNASLLTGLEDEGTTASFIFVNKNTSAPVLDDLFTQLPSTTKTATLDVRGNPGSATCDPTIATDKGYTVIT